MLTLFYYVSIDLEINYVYITKIGVTGKKQIQFIGNTV